jgi:protein TonB
MQNRPPSTESAAAPTPPPETVPARPAAAAPTEPAAVEPTPSPQAETYGAVYEVTIPRPQPTPTAAEAESAPYDLRHVDKNDVVAPVLVSRVEPTYPESARRARAEGRVAVEAVISDRGEVQDARVIQSTTIPLLNEEALRAVRQWRYRPALLKGKPVRVYVTVTVTFRLN